MNERIQVRMVETRIFEIDQYGLELIRENGITVNVEGVFLNELKIFPELRLLGKMG